MIQDERVFKLVFSTDGHFLHAEDPDGNKAKMDLTIEEMSEKRYETRQGELASFRDLMLANSKEFMVRLIDVPGNSYCCGICGGRLFCWC